MSFALHLSSDGRSSHLLPPLLFPGEIQVLSQVHVCASQVPTAQTGWRREGDLRILTHSSLQSSSLQKTLLSYTTSHLMAMLLASLTAPPTPHSQEWVMLFLCSVLAIPVSVQMSLALTWIYFSLDSFYFQPANIHFIPEVTHRGSLTHMPAQMTQSNSSPQDAIQTEETESRTNLSESETPTRPQITWKLEPLQQVD